MASSIDWTPIEADYRIGKLSVKAIAAKHGVSYSGLRKKAQECGWTQDLTPVVQAATRAELTKQAQQRAQKAAKEPPPTPAKPTDADVVAQSAAQEVKVLASAIDAAVIENVAVINRHRSMADSLMRLAGTLAQEVQTLTSEAQDKKDLLETLGDRVDAVRKLSQTVATVVDIERKAHNLDAQPAGDDAIGDLIRSLQGSSLPVVADDPEAREA